MTETSMAQPAQGMDTPPLREFAAHAYVRRYPAAGLFLAVVCLFLLIAGVVPLRYKAVATLAVLPAPEFTVRPDAGSNELNASALAMDQIMKAETGILESDDLHRAVLGDIGVGTLYPELAELPAPGLVHRWLRWLATPWLGPRNSGTAAAMDKALRRFASDLDVHASKDGNVIDLTFGAFDGDIAARVTNGLLATYAARRSHLYDDPQLRVVTREVQAVRNAAADADARLAAFKAAHSISSYDEERSMLLKRRSDAQQSLAEADMSVAEQQARIAALDRQISGQPKVTDFYTERDTDARLQTLDAALVDLRSRLAAARVRYLDTSRVVTDLNTKIASRLEERRNLAADPTPSVARTGPSPVADQLKLERARCDAEYAAASSRSISLQRQMADISAALLAADANERSMDDLQRDKRSADENLATANRVMAERRLTEAEDALRLANVRIIQAAHAPLQPGPMKMLLVLAGVIVGAMASSVYVIWGYAARPTFLTAAGLAQATGLPVLGVFPAVSNADSAVFAV